MTNISITHCALATDHPDASLTFYRDLLGLEVRGDVGRGTQRWITVGHSSQPDVDIVIGPPGADASPEDRATITELMAKGLFGWLVLTSDDLEATFEKLVAADAEIVQEPIDQPWGARDCAVRDPAGNMIRINQR